MLEMVLGQPQSVVAQFVHDLGDRRSLFKHRGELVVGIAPVVCRGRILTVVGDVDVTGIDRHEFVDHLLPSSPAGHRGGTAPRLTKDILDYALSSRNRVQFQKGLSEAQFAVLYGTEDQCREAVMRWRWPSG